MYLNYRALNQILSNPDSLTPLLHKDPNYTEAQTIDLKI